MFKKLFPSPWLALILFVVWLLLQNKLSAGVVVLGIILASLISGFCHRGLDHGRRVHRPLQALQYFFMLLYDILVANVKIAILILSYKRRLKPALIEFPLDLEGALPITILASTISLTPGTISAEINKERNRLLIHALNVEDPDAMILEIKERYERRLKEIFAC